MKTIATTLFLSFLVYTSALAQVADGINYQAVALGSDGEVIAGTDADWNIIEDEKFNVRFSIKEGSHDGQILYQEVHNEAHTDPFGMFSLIIGHGDDTGNGRHTNILSIPWGTEKVFLKVEIDINRDGGYRTMDIQQMMSVPFAFHARSAGTISKIEAPQGHNPDEPIFSVKNSNGDIVFAVYESGVVINIADDDTPKGTRSGFAVGGFPSAAKGDYIEYLRVDPGSVQISIDDTYDPLPDKGTRGGFAIGGFSARKKSGIPDYFSLTPGSAVFNLDEDLNDPIKGTRSGFAVGGFSRQGLKGSLTTNYLTVNRDTARIYIDDSTDKGTRGGFAIGGFSSVKNPNQPEFIRIDPGYVRIEIDDTPDKGTRSGFAIGGFSTRKVADLPDYLHITSSGTQFIFHDDPVKGIRGGFAVGGFSRRKGDGMLEYLSIMSDSTRIYIEEPAAGRGGFAVIERDNKERYHDVFYVSPEQTSVYLKENRKNPDDGFSVFSRYGEIPERLFSVSEEGTFVSTLFESVPVLFTSFETRAITSTEIFSGGFVLSKGSAEAELEEYGVVYNLTGAPSITVPGSVKVLSSDLSGTGEFTVDIKNLEPGTTYYIRAFARNRTGTGYGQEIAIQTPSE